MYTRRDWIRITLGGSALALASGAACAGRTKVAGVPITVYKSPTCTCCHAWVKHLEANGFTVDARDVPDVTPFKAKFGVPDSLASCHTATVGGYVAEGHVPADLIHKMLAEKPAILGLAVPGMVNGSPGMEGLLSQAYDVLAFTRDGRTSVYARR